MKTPKKKSNHDSGSSTRPYRSKRHPPCTQCRQKKLRCESQNGGICQRCHDTGIDCSFNALLSRPLASSRSNPTPERQEASSLANTATTNIATDAAFGQQLPTHTPFSDPHLPETQGDDFIIPSPSTYDFPERPLPQAIQTLDQLKDFSYQLIGASGESDPWLLRHCKFDEHGFLLVHQVHFRNAGGVPLDEKIPVHFLVTDDQLYGPAKAETRITSDTSDNLREKLYTLVPLECGQRLVSLYALASLASNII